MEGAILAVSGQGSRLLTCSSHCDQRRHGSEIGTTIAGDPASADRLTWADPPGTSQGSARGGGRISCTEIGVSGRVPRRGSLPRVQPGPDRPQMRRRRAGLFLGRAPQPHARGSVRELAAVRPPVADPPNGAALHASRSCIQCRPGSPDGRRAQCHGLAAPPVSFLPSQTGSSHPPVAYRMARLPVPLVRRHRMRSSVGKTTAVRVFATLLRPDGAGRRGSRAATW